MATPVKGGGNLKAGGNARGPRGGASVSTATITSRDNRWLKEFRLALRGGLATETGAVGVEGVRLVEEALRSGCPIDAVLFSESGERHHERLAPVIDRPEIAIPILRTTDRLFEGVADTEHPQGVAALVRPRPASFDELLKTPDRRLFPSARGSGGRAGSGKCRDDHSHGLSVWRNGCCDGSVGTKWDGEPVFAKGAAGFGGSSIALADCGGDVAADFAHTAARRGSADFGVGRARER